MRLTILSFEPNVQHLFVWIMATATKMSGFLVLHVVEKQRTYNNLLLLKPNSKGEWINPHQNGLDLILERNRSLRISPLEMREKRRSIKQKERQRCS